MLVPLSNLTCNFCNKEMRCHPLCAGKLSQKQILITKIDKNSPRKNKNLMKKVNIFSLPLETGPWSLNCTCIHFIAKLFVGLKTLGTEFSLVSSETVVSKRFDQ